MIQLEEQYWREPEGARAPSPGGRLGELCDAAWPSAEPGEWLLCLYPAVSIWHYRCVCGHEADKQTCGEHEPGPDIDVGCKQCYDQNGQECPMTFTKVRNLP
jgi:hypothetical protein